MAAQLSPLRVKFQALEFSIVQQSSHRLELFHQNVGYKVTKTNMCTVLLWAFVTF
jgi:hypothetical protein